MSHSIIKKIEIAREYVHGFKEKMKAKGQMSYEL
jgi:hypothetical protein